MNYKKYKVEIEFIEIKTVEIETESVIAAKEIVHEKIQNGDMADFVSNEAPSDFYERIISVEEQKSRKNIQCPICGMEFTTSDIDGDIPQHVCLNNKDFRDE